MTTGTTEAATAACSTRTSRPFGTSSAPGSCGTYVSLWVGMSVCIPTYMLSAGYDRVGNDWRQSLLAILLGNAIVLVSPADQRLRGHPLRDPLPGVRARIVRSHRGAHPVSAALGGGVRLVRHSDVDRRPRHQRASRHRVDRLGRTWAAAGRSWGTEFRSSRASLSSGSSTCTSSGPARRASSGWRRWPLRS